MEDDARLPNFDRDCQTLTVTTCICLRSASGIITFFTWHNSNTNRNTNSEICLRSEANSKMCLRFVNFSYCLAVWHASPV